MANSKLATFTLDETTGYDHNKYPMVTGVPLKQGRVHDPKMLVLRDGRNRSVDAGAEATARWADDSIKWALLTAPRLNLKGGSRQEFTLTVRQNRRRHAKGTRGVRVRKASDGHHVDTGRLRFTIRKNGPLVQTFESRVKGRWQKRATELDDTVCVKRDGKRVTYLAVSYTHLRAHET